MWDFAPARPAPRRPEIQKHNLAAEIGKLHALAVRVLQLEIGREFPRLDALDDRNIQIEVDWLRRSANGDVCRTTNRVLITRAVVERDAVFPRRQIEELKAAFRIRGARPL